MNYTILTMTVKYTYMPMILKPGAHGFETFTSRASAAAAAVIAVLTLSGPKINISLINK